MASDRSGRPSSWVAAGAILFAFALGGVALALHMWWLFWTALGIFVVGGIIAIASDMFSDVVLDPIHGEEAEPHVSTFRRRVTSEAPQALEPRSMLFGHAPSTRREDEPQEEEQASS